jgi:hypothetical protein
MDTARQERIRMGHTLIVVWLVLCGLCFWRFGAWIGLLAAPAIFLWLVVVAPAVVAYVDEFVRGLMEK